MEALTLPAAILLVVIFLLGVGLGGWLVHTLFMRTFKHAGFSLQHQDCYNCHRPVKTVSGVCVAHPYQMGGYYFCSQRCTLEHHRDRTARIAEAMKPAELAIDVLRSNHAALQASVEKQVTRMVERVDRSGRLLDALAALPDEKRASFVRFAGDLKMAEHHEIGRLETRGRCGKVWIALIDYFEHTPEPEEANAEAQRSTEPAGP